jgi:hypothetical protein
LQAQTATAQGYSEKEDFDTIQAQFDSEQNWADDDTKKLFKFLYHNIPEKHRPKVLKAYESHFTLEKNSIGRQQVTDVTNAIMDDDDHKGVKDKINEAIGKVVSYQDRVNSRR